MRTTKILASIFLTAVLVGCKLMSTEYRDWRFVESVGGMQMGQPIKAKNGKWQLPIDCDVSGIRAITTKPTQINSALICNGFKVRVSGTNIFVTLRTTISGYASRTNAELGNLSSGEYSVSYRDPDGSNYQLGVIRLVAHE